MNTQGGYEIYRNNQDRLSHMLREGRTAIEKLSIKSWTETLDTLQERMASQRFKVMILGEFKRGKSTLINALLGKEVLPAFATPCTAVINEIKWSEEKRAVLHFRNPLPKNFASTIPIRALEHIRQAGDGIIAPLDIPIEDLEQYVVIPDPGKDQAESVSESPYSKVELFWPLKFCANGVEIIDSPGLNEHTTRTQVTGDYLTKVDAVIFVMSCHALCSQSEIDVIDNTLLACGHEDLLFVCNRFDEIRVAERERLVKFAYTKLASKTSFGTNGVYFVSALAALEGRAEGDAARIEKSGIVPLETKLERFLVDDRGRVKLFQPARELSRLINSALNKEIPQQHALLEQSLEKVQRQYNEAKPRLEEAERRRDQILQKVDAKRLELKEEARVIARTRLREVASQLVVWVETLQPINAIKFLKFDSGSLPIGFKRQAESLMKEVTAWLLSKLETEQNEWRKSVLEPLVKRHIETMSSEVSGSMQEFLALVDGIKSDLSGLSVSESGFKDPKPWERVLAAAGGFVVGCVGSAMIGGAMGMQEMMISIVPQTMVVILTTLLVGLNPWILIPTLLATGSLQGILRTGAMTDKIKKKVAEELTNRLREVAPERADEVAKSCYQITAVVQQRAGEGMQKEIQAIHDQVQTVLDQFKNGEAAVFERRKELGSIRTALGNIDSGLNDFILSLTGSLLEKPDSSRIPRGASTVIA